MFGERFVLLQLTLCKTRYSRHGKYIRNNPVITLFLKADTRIPLPRNDLLEALWKAFQEGSDSNFCMH